MGNLKGKNFRICIYDTTAEKYKVVAMSTNCTITLTNNVESINHKDVVGLAELPEVVSQSWSVQVDSLNVADAGAMLTAIKSMTPFTLMWDETSTTDNQTREKAAFARKGMAYMSDLTLTFNNRETSAKSIQMSGTGPLETVGSSEAVEVISVGSVSKGQYTRLYLGSDNTTTPSAVIAYARQLQMHISISLEDSTTKDTVGNWVVQEPTALNYDITTSALVRSGETITSAVGGKTLSDLEDIHEAGTPVKWVIANVSGDNNRTKGAVLASGSCVCTQLQINGPIQDANYQATLTGYGDYTVAA